MHRLRDLDRHERWWAAAVAVAVVLPPIMALIHFLPDWAPNGDPALMAIRSLDVGTSRTPMLGQPSTASAYAGAEGHVHHPGPLHFYLMAVPIRVLGGALAMPLVSVVITGTCLLVSTWAVFRQLGKAAGVLAAALLALTAFTTGAASFVNPVSSMIAGYPLLVTAVLGWCVLCGDLRLLPLATAALSFTAQQHLSVDPALAVLTAGVAGLTTWRLLRARGRADIGGPHTRELRRWGGWSLLVALVMWSPVILQQLFGDLGNVGQMIDFARHGNSESLGYGKATWQIAHAFGLPPLLGRTDLTGSWLTSRPSPVTWVTAGAVLATIAVIGRRRRADDPRVSALATMVGLICLAGLVSGASVPVGMEQRRITFYHWAVTGAFLAALTLGAAALRPARRLLARQAPTTTALRLALGAVAILVVAAPSVVNLGLDRRSNDLEASYIKVTRDEVDAAVDAITARSDRIGDHVVVLAEGEPAFISVKDAIGFALVERGVDIRFPLSSRYFVHDQRLVDRDALDGAVLLVIDRATPRPAPAGGDLLGEIDLQAGAHVPTDHEAWDELLAEVDGSSPPTADHLGTLGDLGSGEVELWTEVLDQSWAAPAQGLAQPGVLDFLVAHPDAAPTLDPELLARARRTVPDEGIAHGGDITRLRVFLLDRDEALQAVGAAQPGRS